LALVIFDLDETLISIDSDYAWGLYLVEKGLVDKANYQETNQQFFKDYKEGIMDVDAYIAFSCAVLAQYDQHFLFEHRAQYLVDHINPHILPKAQALIQSHQAKGDTVIVVTATVDFLTQPIVESLGIGTLIAPVAEVIAGRYTGGTTGIASMGAGKVTRLELWLQKQRLQGQDISMKDSRFYSDSINDLPLLEHVDYPVAVDPDEKLKKVALEKSWSVISLR